MRDALEVVLYAFARLGQRGQGEVLADEESPYMTILQSALTRLLLVHAGGAGDKEMKLKCDAEAAQICQRLIRIARRHGRATAEVAQVAGEAEGEAATALVASVLQAVIDKGHGLGECFSHDGSDTSSSSSSSMGKAFALGSSLLSSMSNTASAHSAGKRKVGEGVAHVVILIIGGVCLADSHAAKMLGDLPSGAKVVLVGTGVATAHGQVPLPVDILPKP